MTAATALAGAAESDGLVAKLWEAIDPDFLTTLSWDSERRVLTFPQDHPRLGYQVCAVIGCTKEGRLSRPLCDTCQLRWKNTRDTSFEDFLLLPRPAQRRIGVGYCVVEGCQRPWVTARKKLCPAHDYQQRDMLLSLEAFLRHPDVVPLPSFGACKVVACTRDRASLPLSWRAGAGWLLI